MKIQNKEVGIKIGNKEKKFTNLILNSYLNLFADSFIEFKNKDLSYCFLNFTNYNNKINEDSTEMNYDTILESDFSNNIEILTSNTIINKYYYKKTLAGEQDVSEFAGKQLIDIGFANYDNTLQKYVMYAYLNVSEYNIIVQENQPIVISRTDKIESDMNLWTNSPEVKGPIHLTMRGLLNLQGYDYNRLIPKLYSIGFGILPYTVNKEYLVEDITLNKLNTGEIEIQEELENPYRKALYFSEDLKLSDNLLFKQASYPFLIYKFKIYEEKYIEPPNATLVDTGIYYTQYKNVEKYGKLKLKIKYERG